MNPNQSTPNENNINNTPTLPDEPVNTWQIRPVANGQTGSEPPRPLPPTDSVPPDQPAYNGLSSVPQPRKSRKKLYIALASGLAVLTLTLGTVFGYYLPNKPENAYRTGMERSGDAIDKLIAEATTKEKLEEIKTGEIAGAVNISTNSKDSFNGVFNIKSDSTKADGSVDVKFQQADLPEQALGLKFLTELKAENRFPDLYFQLSGLKSLGADAFVPGISDYDGKWVAVEAAFLESLSSGFVPPAEDKNKENVTAEEISQVIKTVSAVTNEYVFTADKSKAVLENREYVGKETTDEGVKAFHYKVGINKDHLIAYCKAVSDKFLSEPAVKKIADMDDKEIEEAKKSAVKDCDDSAKDYDPAETFDMWVDTKYKVIHKFRAYEDQKKRDAYTDFGQIYTGGDKLTLFSRYHQDKDNLNVKFTVDVDVKTNNSKAELTAGQDGDGSFKGTGSLAAKPYDGEVKVEKPAGAIPINDILTRFGFDPTGLSGISAGRNAQAQDADFKADINSLYSQIEVFFAENGYYPSLPELNDAQWRQANMPNVSAPALTPNDAAPSALAGVASASQYGYAPSGCNSVGKKCMAYTLTALLNSGEKFTKTGTNN